MTTIPNKTRARGIAEDIAESERSTAAKNASLPQLDLFQFAWKIANTDPSERDGLLEDFISEARVLCAEEWKYIHGEDE